MAVIDLAEIPYRCIESIVYVSERDVIFDTKHDVVSPKTGRTKKFEFEYSTGSEWNDNTHWVYQSEDGYELHICNDSEMVKIRAHNYLKHKLNK